MAAQSLLGGVVTWLRTYPFLSEGLCRRVSAQNSEGQVHMAAWIVWEQVALVGREVFVLNFEQDSVLRFVFEIQLTQFSSVHFSRSAAAAAAKSLSRV